MAEFVIRKGDVLPRLRMALTVNGEAFDLTGSTVTFRMAAVGSDTLKVSAAATVVTAASGIVEYAWQGTDTDTAGLYDAEWQVTTPAGLLTTPTVGAIRIVVAEGVA